MHLIARGISNLVFELVNPSVNEKFKGTHEIYIFTMNATIQQIGNHIKNSRATVPRSFEGAWTEHFHSYRAVDWQDFLGVAVPLIVCPNLQHEGAHSAIMNLVDGCNRALAHELTFEDVLELERYLIQKKKKILNIYLTSLFQKWHQFCKKEVRRGRLSNRVFTINNHYLTHVGDMIRQMGPLRAYSCRPSERAIKGLTNLIKSPSKSGINASNNLLNQRNMESFGFTDMLAEYTHASTHEVRSDSFITSPTSDPDASQLWDPQSQFQTLGDSTFVAGLGGRSVELGLQSYYKRSSGSTTRIELDCQEIQAAGRLWSEGNVYTSEMYHHKHRISTRADNIVLFKSIKVKT